MFVEWSCVNSYKTERYGNYMQLSEKQKSLVEDLMSQEELCIQKYSQYTNLAKDEELKRLFRNIRETEEEHHNSLHHLLEGECPTVNEHSNAVSNYNPVPTYVGNFDKKDKEFDQYLCTDSITTEKYISTAYNDDLFQFGEPEVRKLLNHIQTEEQNHAEMIYKYKTVNSMT